MDSLFLFFPIDENILRVDLLTNFPQYGVLGVLLCLLIFYSLYCKVLWRFLEKTKIPKLYKKTTLHSLWMGCVHLMISIICFSQLGILSHRLSTAKVSQPDFLSEILHAASANICQLTIEHNDSYAKSQGPVQLVEWTPFNSISIIIICGVLIQEIFLATRNKMDYIFYSRLLGLMFAVSAVKTRCPALSIQGSYLMSVNSSSKEIARALVAWNSYSQEDSDHRPSPIMKALTFLVFLFHMFVWSSLMLYYMPFFIHKMPSINETDANRLFLAYAHLLFLAYIMVEAGTSPLWKSFRCLGWCRRSSGLTWRIFALSDCHLLGHYGALVMELYNIQLVSDMRKSNFRNKMVQKHLASLEGRKREPTSDSQTRRPASLLAAVKTVVALKKKMQRRAEDISTRSVTLEDLPQVFVTPADSTDLLDNQLEVSSETSGQVEEKSSPEKDEVTSIENVMDTTFAKEDEESLIDPEGLGGDDGADVIQD